MGLNFHIPLPGPISYSVPLTGGRRRRTVYVKTQNPAPEPTGYEGGATTLGGVVWTIFTIWALFDLLTGHPIAALFLFLAGWVLCALIVLAFGKPVYEDQDDSSD